MNEINLFVEIISLDSDLKFNVVGEYKNGRIIFIDDEGNTNYILKLKDSIEYYKKGSVDMKYKFELDKITKGHYAISGNKFEFDIVTNNLYYDDTFINIKYDLYQGSDLVNKTELRVTFKSKEESSWQTKDYH